MTILNSIFDANDVKVPNIILNTFTSIIIGLVNGYRIYEKIQAFHQLQLKFHKLTSNIEKKLLDMETITSEDIKSSIEIYDNLLDNMDYPISNDIKSRIKKQFADKVSLPSILNVDVVICSDRNCCV
jgi:hypothetical protein